MRTVELLAPAGDMDCFMAAVNAGADAVYLGGEAYGARAYASNFSKEEICYAIRYAHLFGIKIYLTVNTLVKEQELSALCEFLMPFYEAGLDGVIVQDFGVLSLIRSTFPGLSLHASTQMCITGAYGAALLKDYGVSRIVPARELSIEELVYIKEKTGIEIETFIHGAMCYSYSGQCLFSSFLGRRSGNRGRCAGPCRLPYDAFGYNGYPLSLKDMCTLPILFKLAGSGMDSFKIEGRMKNPYYVAGVTAIYAKYLDLYKKNGMDSDKPIKIDKKDLEFLRKLYVRTELETGYYERHNGKEMITLQKPGYETGDEKEFSWIKDSYLNKNRQLPISGKLVANAGGPLTLAVYDEEGTAFMAEGNIVEKARNRAVTEDEIRRQLEKTGNTPFHFRSVSVIMSGDVFIPIKELNALRRDALEGLFSLLAGKFQRTDIQCRQDRMKARTVQLAKAETAGLQRNTDTAFAIHILSMEQFYEVIAFLDGCDLSDKELSIVIPPALWERKEQKDAIQKLCAAYGLSCYFSLPRVFRRQAADYCDTLLCDKSLAFFDGFYCGSLDALGYIKDRLLRSGIKPESKVLFGDFSLYAANYEAVCFLQEMGISGITAPYELSSKEWQTLYERLKQSSDTQDIKTECLIYGHIPFMQSANCIKKTYDRCDHKREVFSIKDRMGKRLPVLNDCKLCENTIYNSIPLSLHEEWKTVCCDTYKLSFTIEDKKQVRSVLNSFLSSKSYIPADFTKGHYKKGIL